MKSWGCAQLAALGLFLMMLRRVTVKTVKLVDLIQMRKADCSGETRLVPHISGSLRAGKQLFFYYLILL